MEFIRKLRVLKLKAGKSLILGAANHLIRGTDLAAEFQDNKVKQSWYYSFRNRWGIKVENQTQLEMGQDALGNCGPSQRLV